MSNVVHFPKTMRAQVRSILFTEPIHMGGI